MGKLVKNAIQCKLCGDVIESKHGHDYVSCSCGNCAVDGGHEYQKILCKSLDTIVNLAVEENDQKQ